MAEHPILFSAPMVRAILAGTKTQTRRIWKMPKGLQWYVSGALRGEETGDIHDPDGPWWGSIDEVHCRYGEPGDLLWVREAWSTHACFDGIAPRDLTTRSIHYWADGECVTGKKRASLHMPRALSRITLGITGVRVERLQDISEADALAEGIERPENIRDVDVWDGAEREMFNALNQPVSQYRRLWNSINGADSWGANPWVWVVEFKRLLT